VFWSRMMSLLNDEQKNAIIDILKEKEHARVGLVSSKMSYFAFNELKKEVAANKDKDYQDISKINYEIKAIDSFIRRMDKKVIIVNKEIEDEKILARYSNIHTISEKEKSLVTLVIDGEKNQIAVKKVVKKNESDVYVKLKEVNSVHIPQIYHILEEEDTVIILEEYAEGFTLKEKMDIKKEKKLVKMELNHYYGLRNA
jgi:hypothetical protein